MTRSTAAAPLRLKNLCASAAFVLVACMAYAHAPYNAARIAGTYRFPSLSFTGSEFLWTGAAAYIVLLAAYYLTDRSPRPAKALMALQAFVQACQGAIGRLDPARRVAVLTCLLKGFFGPMMAMSLLAFCSGFVAHGWSLLHGSPSDEILALFNRHGFWFVMQLLLFIDVLIFTVGYLVEIPRLGNEIRSVDPTLLGWTAALLCYPPFNTLTSKVLGSPVSDFPRFDEPAVHMALNLLLLSLMALYTWASVALGLKASNLTHRGIVRRGPYAVIRHPAYACKNAAWWIASVPLVSTAFGQSMLDGVQALASVAGWTALYVLRALTEEDHLRRVDGEYAAYAARVRNRFIPGLV